MRRCGIGRSHRHTGTYMHPHTVCDPSKNGNSSSSKHTYKHAQAATANIHFLSCTFIVSRVKNSVRLAGNPTQSSYTAMCCFAPWHCVSGASVNSAIVWSALPKGFTGVSPLVVCMESHVGLALQRCSQKHYRARDKGKRFGVEERGRFREELCFYCQTAYRLLARWLMTEKWN